MIYFPELYFFLSFILCFYLFFKTLLLLYFYIPLNTKCTIFFSIFKKILFIFLAALGLCCCAWAFSSCGEPGLLFVAVHELLIAVASLVAEHGF